MKHRKKEYKVVAVIEARMGSERLPGKTLVPVVGKPLLERVVDRIRLAKSVEEIIVATSVHTNDTVIESFCKNMKIACYRGSEEDVLDRVYQASKQYKPECVVQAGADCPFYDPELIDLLVSVLRWGGFDYAANDMKLTYPEGVDAHIIRFSALQTCAREAQDTRERDDTPRFIWNHPERFHIFNLEAVPGSILNRPDLRLTVDYPEDLRLTEKIYRYLSKKEPRFSTADVISVLDKHPDWARINRHCEQRSAAYKP